MTGVVLDTNVLVSANLNSQGLESLVVSLAMSRKVRLFLSEPILAEYEQVLLYPKLKFNPEAVSLFMDLVWRTGTIVKPRHTVTASRDDADNRFLECAEVAKADYLITGNKQHF